MKGTASQPLWTSVILHLAVLALLLLAVLFEAFRPRPKQHVFQMVSPPEIASPSPETPTATPQPLPELPDIEPLPELPEVKLKPLPQPEAPAPAAKPAVIDYNQFVRQHGKPKPRDPAPPRPTARPAAPTITAPRLELPANSAAADQPTARELSELQRYSAQLNARIKAAWRPPELGGARASVTVIFHVTASGQITKLRLQPPSGLFTFDQSIRDAFRKVANAGPTPTGRSHQFSMRFEKAR